MSRGVRRDRACGTRGTVDGRSVEISATTACEWSVSWPCESLEITIDGELVDDAVSDATDEIDEVARRRDALGTSASSAVRNSPALGKRSLGVSARARARTGSQGPTAEVEETPDDPGSGPMRTPDPSR